MTLFSNPTCPHSHRVRIVLAEKGISLDVVDVESSLPEDLIELNPYNSVPTLVDRDLVLYDSRIIAEYLDERFPHPPLMPVDPVSRARFRLALYHVERDWYSLVDDLEHGDKRTANKARKTLRESLLASAELFGVKPFFMSEEFSLVDCSIAPILWRLPRWEVDLPPSHGRPIIKYAENLFSRPSFRASLTELEREMRP
ncbi:MAG: glutathione S-transferase N-terminal domain-containing protein [Gammaproteobacteria bacterium]|jgi:RNA polymerase-associated protein